MSMRDLHISARRDYNVSASDGDDAVVTVTGATGYRHILKTVTFWVDDTTACNWTIESASTTIAAGQVKMDASYPTHFDYDWTLQAASGENLVITVVTAAGQKASVTATYNTIKG